MSETLIFDKAVFVRMIKKCCYVIVFIAFIFTTIACGGLRFSQLAPEAIDFHPQSIAIFPMEVWNHKEPDSRAVVEQIVAGSLIAKKMFIQVTDVEKLQKHVQENETLKNTKTEYLSKLRLLNFSDSDLSRKIGTMLQVEAILMLSVDEWKYVVQGDQKTAQVGLTMELYDVSTGKLMWKANHAVAKDYVLIKPDLPDLARSVVDKMVYYMPH